jgi:hypothetical protein
MKLTLVYGLYFALLVAILVCILAPTQVDGATKVSSKTDSEELMKADLKKQTKYREKFCRNQERTNKNLKYRNEIGHSSLF